MSDTWTQERDKMLDDIAANLDPSYVHLVASLKPILDENMRLRSLNAEMREELANLLAIAKRLAPEHDLAVGRAASLLSRNAP